jgi:hypothetical protein
VREKVKAKVDNETIRNSKNVEMEGKGHLWGGEMISAENHACRLFFLDML